MDSSSLLPAYALKRTTFFKTQAGINQLLHTEEPSLASIMNIYLKEKRNGSLDYARALLRRRGIVYASLKREIFQMAVHKQVSGCIELVIQQMHACGLLERTDLVKVLRQLTEEHPQQVYQVMHQPQNTLLGIFKIIDLDTFDAMAIISRTVLEKNKDRVLDYINEQTYSQTLKYLTKDVQGIKYLIDTISQALIQTVDQPATIKNMVDRAISLYISLEKIDYTRVLLTPIITNLKERLARAILTFGAEVGAETFFRAISRRLEEIIAHSGATSPMCPTEERLVHQEDLLDFLFSLIPYNSMVETLALSISRDFVLNRASRYQFLQILEQKFGTQRLTNISIIKNDFQYFSQVHIPPAQALAAVQTRLASIAEIEFAPKPQVSSFVYSCHYWPENNYASPEDVFSTTIEHTPTQPSAHPHPNTNNTLALDYAREHTYANITVTSHGRSQDFTLPIIYLEYLDPKFNTTGIPESTLIAIESFWSAHDD
ncbi:hypothetical protein NEHOM01_0340 [Nematocida homosporus]|uniref:uncharacterized protein n=1 Tax=Nematocida homosporus TaxID=1912981 RepID=UPI00221F6520|nr:uncharacterized protein NEHOM01_0340 [Nematocida homosporus]KAI5184738.1 hypothetical protein NEHOM01_0340 [Nematocida homosporus]